MDSQTQQLIQRGREAYHRKDYVAALADLREVLRRNPDFADVRHLTGLCLGFLGQSQAALDEFQYAIRLNDSYVEAHLNAAITLTELGRYDEAREAFLRAGELEKGADSLPAAVSAKLANAHMTVGDLYVEAGVHQEAVVQYEAALRMRPRFHDIRHKLARAFMEMGQWDRAEAELCRVLEGNERFLAARLDLGLVQYRLRRPQQAAEQWLRCQEQRPDHPQVRAYLAMLEREAASPKPAGGDA